MATTDTIVLQAVPTNPDGATLGNSITDKIGFYGTTPVAQRAGAAQAAVTTTASTSTSPVGYSTTTQADAVVTLLNEMRTVLVNVGLMKGAA